MSQEKFDEKKDSVQDSRAYRQEVLANYGFIPTSVLIMKMTNKHGITEFGRKQAAVSKEATYERLKRKYNGDEVLIRQDLGLRGHISGQTVRGKDGGLSIFPAELCRFVMQFYSDEGDIVLDPMAGHNSRMQMTWKMGRHYIGYDVCHEFMEFNRDVANKIQNAEGALLALSDTDITLHEQSSEKMVENNDSVDLVFTSPPYWCIEFYDDSPGQMGLNSTYEEFMKRMTEVFREALRVLKPGKFCVWNVNDFRYKGKFYPYHVDTIAAAVAAGFDIWDTGIVKWGAKGGFGKIFIRDNMKRKVLGKDHEYLLIFKKPEQLNDTNNRPVEVMDDDEEN